MSRFRDDFALAFQDVLFERGDSLVYRPLAGAARPVTAVVMEKSVLKQEQNHDTQSTILEVQLLKSALNSRPREGDVIEWDDLQWGFQTVISDEGDVYRLTFEMVEITQHGKKPSNL